MNDSLDDNEEVYSNESKEKSKDVESYPAYYILLSPLELENRKSRLHKTAIRHFHFGKPFPYTIPIFFV